MSESQNKSRLIEFDCLKCGENWIFSTTDLGSKKFECPDCGNMNEIKEDTP